MLKILDEKILRTDDDIEQEYKNCKYLYIIDNEGYLYCVSASNDSFDELFDVKDDRCWVKCPIVSGYVKTYRFLVD